MGAFKPPPVQHVNRWTCSSCQAESRKHLRLAGFPQSRNSSTTTRRTKLPDAPARTRFAPSPTGNLHLGSIRTALFNYLIARRTGGQFLLRVEDTDRKRTVAGAEQRLCEDLKWAGLHWDEGPEIGGPYGPYRQSERTEIYRKHIQPLLDNGHAYRCFCSAERLDKFNRLRHEKGLPLGYDRKCEDIPRDQSDEKALMGDSYIVRFRVPKEYPKFNDFVYGKTGHGAEKNKKLQIEEPVYDDPVLIKSDGHPTYHFANVVDDQLMKITHVIRGSEWMSSTPLHIALYQAFGWTPPAYGHVPLLVDHNKQKLSKRNFDSDIASFRNAGVFPESLTNFAALLGWSHQQKSDVMNLRQLESIFDLKFTKGNTIVSFDKLTYLQEQHARRRVNDGGEPLEQMIRDVAVILLDQYGAASIARFIGKRKLRDIIASMLRAESLPYRSPVDFVQKCSVFLSELKRMDPFEVGQMSLLPSLRAAAAALCLTPADYWTKEVHRANLAMVKTAGYSDDTATEKREKRELYHYLRWALLGGTSGPSIPETMEILGREACLNRIKEAAYLTKDMETMAAKPDIKIGSEHSSHHVTL